MINTNDPCFVFGLNLDANGGATDLDTEDLSSSWIHVDYGHEEINTFLASLEVPEKVIDSLIQPDTRPRTVILKNGILVMMRAINLNPGADPEDMVSLRMWIVGDRLITVRQRKLLSIQDIRSNLLAGEGPTNTPELVIAIIAKIADRISDYVEDIDDQLVNLEISTQENFEQSSRTKISAIRREIAGVRRYLSPQRDALESLYSHSIKAMPEGYAFHLREQMERMVRYLEDLDLMRERTLVLQEEWSNMSMEQQNSRMYVLSIVALIFLPITFVTGIFGMNVSGVPGIDNPDAFSIVAGSMAFISVAVIIFLKYKRWF